MGAQLTPLLGWGRKPPTHKRHPVAQCFQTAGLESKAVFRIPTEKLFVGRKLAELVDCGPHSRT
eukprot:8687827-Alexandrium_andersonii.AAC.1